MHKRLCSATPGAYFRVQALQELGMLNVTQGKLKVWLFRKRGNLNPSKSVNSSLFQKIEVTFSMNIRWSRAGVSLFFIYFFLYSNGDTLEFWMAYMTY